eukprot:Skav234991  [mRNA]  locus=scaffold122:310237:317701:+ [translate_table: standard]
MTSTTSEVYISQSAGATISSDSNHLKKVTFNTWTPMGPPGLQDGLDKSKPMYVPLEEDPAAWCRSTASGSAPESSEEEADGEKQEVIDDEDPDISHLLASIASLIGDDAQCAKASTTADVKALEEDWNWGTPTYLRPKNFCAWCGVPRNISHSFCPQCGVAFAYLD